MNGIKVEKDNVIARSHFVREPIVFLPAHDCYDLQLDFSPDVPSFHSTVFMVHARKFTSKYLCIVVDILLIT